MSDNQEEFEALRKAAYPFVTEYGKDAERLHNFCKDFMRNWRERHGPRDKDDGRLIRDVVRWTMNVYNIPRYKPKRNREQRAAHILMAPGALTVSGEIYGRESIRNAARLLGQSKSTVSRHLIRQGVSPRRDVKIRKLSKTAQQLARILDATFNARSAGILQLDRLGTALWDDGKPRPVPATTQASRKKKLSTLLAEVSQAGLGYNIVTAEDICGIFRGRRFRSLSEANTWIAESRRLGRYLAIVRLTPTAPTQDYFWADPIVIDVMSIIDMGVTGHFYPVEKLEPIFRFERLLLDMTPVMPWLERAYHSYAGDDMAENLNNLAEKITDPGVRKAVRKLASIIRNLHGHMGAYPACFDAFQTADFVLGIMDKTAESSPESYAKLAYIRDWFEQTVEDYMDARDRLSRMLELEKSGEWQPPDAETLSQYLPILNVEEITPENDIEL